MRPNYKLNEQHQYNPNIAQILDNDPLQASTTVNPVLEQMINNTNALYNQLPTSGGGGGGGGTLATVERGTWSPTISGTEFLDVHFANYARTGDIVTIGALLDFRISQENRTTTGTWNKTLMRGLPFGAKNHTLIHCVLYEEQIVGSVRIRRNPRLVKMKMIGAAWFEPLSPLDIPGAGQWTNGSPGAQPPNISTLGFPGGLLWSLFFTGVYIAQ